MAPRNRNTGEQAKEGELYIGAGFFMLIIIAFILAIKFPVMSQRTIKESATIIENAVIVDKQTYAVGNGRTSLPAPLLICNLDGQENIPVYVYWNWNAMHSTLRLTDSAAWFNSKHVGDCIDTVYKIPEWKHGKPTEQYHYYIFINGIEDKSF